jgi:hypothetical protein
VTEALEEKLNASPGELRKPWMKHVGKLKRLQRETRRIEKTIEGTFEEIEPEQWK